MLNSEITEFQTLVLIAKPKHFILINRPKFRADPKVLGQQIWLEMSCDLASTRFPEICGLEMP